MPRFQPTQAPTMMPSTNEITVAAPTISSVHGRAFPISVATG